MNKRLIFRQIRSRGWALWNDQSGETSIMSLVLICAILVIGVTVGVTSLRDQLAQEFGDVAAAIQSLNQSYSAGPYGTYTDNGPFPVTNEIDFP
ncbi:MAG: hypothetical protein GX575_27615 [Candidatus Anammoximicrobium sp.]|nr:hypothetical protein [Candidatus Anammoximicrobium sp.]